MNTYVIKFNDDTNRTLNIKNFTGESILAEIIIPFLQKISSIMEIYKTFSHKLWENLKKFSHKLRDFAQYFPINCEI